MTEECTTGHRLVETTLLSIMDSIKITLETLYDILRNEKKREDLQKLESTFFEDVVHYLKEKNNFMEAKKNEKSLFASGERDKLDYEIRSIKRILKEIYEKREKKIIDITINRSRTGSEIIDTSSMLKEEKEFYTEILKILDHFRKGILQHLFIGEMPSVINPSLLLREEHKTLLSEIQPPFTKFEELPPKPTENETESEADEDSEEKPSSHLVKDTTQKETEKETIRTAQAISAPTISEPAKVKIRIIRPMPSFIWKDQKIYGPYTTGEEIEMFPEVAELMIRKNRAEKI